VVDNALVRCSRPDSDPDGDGWGWENGRSCEAGDAGPIVPDDNNPTPYCRLSNSDPDGDGWGWEQGRSCRVLAEPPEPPAPALLTIMAVGDSITHGSYDGLAKSYREPLVRLLDSQSCNYAMLGSQTGNFQHRSFVSPHEGYQGHTADELLYGHVDHAGRNEGITAMVTGYQPDLMLLHIGTNDMRLGQNIDQTVAEIDQIVSTVFALRPDTIVYIANLVPWYASSVVEIAVRRLGDRIERYVSEQSDTRLILVDVRSGFTKAMMLPDKAHPNPGGEAHIAGAFLRSLQASGYCD